MHRLIYLLFTLGMSVLLASCSAIPIDRPLHAASGMTSQLMCAETFISGFSPKKSFSETIESVPGLASINWALRYDVDETQKQIKATVFGGFESKAIYRDDFGCLLVRGDQPENPASPARHMHALLAAVDIITPDNEALRAALARAFSEPTTPLKRRTRAVVVIHNGKIVAEQYAPGIRPSTPLKSWSVAKTVTNALIGTLVHQGKLSVNQPAPFSAWQNKNDPRHAITIDMLLRQTSGLALAQTNSGFDPSTRMKFIEHDMAGYAQTATVEAMPGTRWAYTDGNYMLLSRIIRDTVGGTGSDVREFAQRELFTPLGMRKVTMEYDATGTPLGSHSIYASARDWARLGLLYLNDGVADGRRILPAGWVRYSTTQTLNTGYAAGLFVNQVAGKVPGWGVPWGMPQVPQDAFFARGYMGQFIVVVPSEKLVVARFAASQIKGDDIVGANELVADVITAIRHRNMRH